MKKFVVITSIQPPTPAIERMSRLKEWTVVVVGDTKTPANWSCERVVYLGVDEQSELGFAVAGELPFRHYARKNIGYLYAIRQGADVIFETDDDNLLLGPEIPVGLQRQSVSAIASSDRFVNIYRLFTDRAVWPRGFPLNLIRSQSPIEQHVVHMSVPVHQGLANHDPDVDAIYRLVSGELFDFEGTGRYALAPGTFCPFNSQATLWYPDAYWAMLLPASVAMRVTDIWRGYIAQVLLAKYGHAVLFTEPIMRQHRNVHDLLQDFSEELPFYRDAQRFVDIADSTPRRDDPLDALTDCYRLLQSAGLLGDRDLRVADAWTRDLRVCMRAADR